MANELFADDGLVSTKYANVESLTGTIWNGSALVTYVTADIANYDIALSQRGSTTGYYGTMPATLPSGVYRVKYFSQAAGSPSELDTMFHQEYLRWGDGVITPVDMVASSFTYSVTTQASAFQYAIYYQGAGVKIRCTADPAAAIDLTDFVADIGVSGDYDSFTEANGGLEAVDESTGIFDINPTAAQSAAWPLQDTVINVWRNDSDDNRVPVIMGKLTMRSTLRGAT